MLHYAVTLGADAAAREQLSEVDRRLAQLPGLQTISQLGETHHLSLAVYAALPAGGFDAALADFAASLPRLRLKLTSIAIFPGVALFLAPVVTAELLALHRRYHDALEFAAPHCWDYYRPGNWVPHVTLAMDIAPEVLPEALAIVTATWQAGEMGLDELGLIEVWPVRRLATHRLAPA